MDRLDVSEKLKNFLETECRLQVPGPDSPLDIDSFNMMLIITYSGEELRVPLGMDILNFDATMSLDSLTDLIVGVANSK